MVLSGQKNPTGQPVQDVIPSVAKKPLPHGSGALPFMGHLTKKIEQNYINNDTYNNNIT